MGAKTELASVAESIVTLKPAGHGLLTQLTAVVGAVVGYAFGGWTEALSFLFVVMGVDYVTGILSAVKEGKGLCSVVGFWGLLKKGLMLVVILVAHRADILLESENMALTGAAFFFIANELISVVENLGVLGVPLPPQLKNIIAALQNRGKS